MHTARGARAFNRFIKQNADFWIAGKRLENYFPATTSSDTESLRDPREQMFRFLRTRRLMMTIKGCIGLVPINTQQGDIICLLLGCDVPMVLRVLENQQYKVVGGCYVHGVMEGEAMEWLEAGQRHTEEIILC